MQLQLLLYSEVYSCEYKTSKPHNVKLFIIIQNPQHHSFLKKKENQIMVKNPDSRSFFWRTNSINRQQKVLITDVVLIDIIHDVAT